jgi:hypothetical protein
MIDLDSIAFYALMGLLVIVIFGTGPCAKVETQKDAVHVEALNKPGAIQVEGKAEILNRLERLEASITALGISVSTSAGRDVNKPTTITTGGTTHMLVLSFAGMGMVCALCVILVVSAERRAQVSQKALVKTQEGVYRYAHAPQAPNQSVIDFIKPLLRAVPAASKVADNLLKKHGNMMKGTGDGGFPVKTLAELAKTGMGDRT